MSCFLNDRRPDPDVSSYLLSSCYMISLICSYPHQTDMNSLWSVYWFVFSLHACWFEISVCLLFVFTLCNSENPSKHQHFSRFYATKKHPISRVLSGADNQIRTGDLVLTKDALCRLSYISIKWTLSEREFIWRSGTGSNRRPLAWQASVLTIWTTVPWGEIKSFHLTA